MSMEREISFNELGDIVVDTATMREEISCGVVLLTHSQADEARKHGWEPFGATSGEALMGLTRVRRQANPTLWPSGAGAMPTREEDVERALASLSETTRKPGLLSLLYDCDMMPEQCRTMLGARHLALVCALWNQIEGLRGEKTEGTLNALQSLDYAKTELRVLAHMMDDGALPWRPIAELDDVSKYGDEAGFLLMAPELVDADCNAHGVGLGYWQDDGLQWHASQEECDAWPEDRPRGSWMSCKWSMTNDEWAHVCVNPTHYLRLRGVK